MNPLVYIIILNWNGKDLTLDCLKSLSKIQYDNFKILVIDNGSTDDSVKIIKQKSPNVEILQIDKNIGYAAGNNAGFNHIKNKNLDYIIFLNNDTTVDPNFIEPLIKPLIEKSDIYQTVPKIYYSDNPDTIWYAGGKVNKWLGLVYHKGIRKKDNYSINQTEYTDYATGCCFCMRTKDFDELGGFDTSYPMYGEDVDLSLRIHAAGKNVYYIPNSNIWHKVSASMGGNLNIGKMVHKLSGVFRIMINHFNILQILSGSIFLIFIYLPIKSVYRILNDIIFVKSKI